MYFRQLTAKITPKLKGIIHGINYHYLYFNEEDLFQEAMLHLWQDFNAGKLDNKTTSYILQGCYFYLKNYMRCHKPKARTISWDAPKPLQLVDPETQDYQEKLDIKLLAETIRNNGLDRREKMILSYYAEGLNTRDIGKRLNISHVRVVELTRRIRQKCHKYLEET